MQFSSCVCPILLLLLPPALCASRICHVFCPFLPTAALHSACSKHYCTFTHFSKFIHTHTHINIANVSLEKQKLHSRRCKKNRVAHAQRRVLSLSFFLSLSECVAVVHRKKTAFSWVQNKFDESIRNIVAASNEETIWDLKLVSRTWKNLSK